MNEMELFQLTENLKDCFQNIYRIRPEIKCSDEAIERAAGLTAKILDNFNKLMEEKKTQEAWAYLMDTAMYYCVLCADIQITNENLVRMMQEYIPDDEDG